MPFSQRLHNLQNRVDDKARLFGRDLMSGCRSNNAPAVGRDSKEIAPTFQSMPHSQIRTLSRAARRIVAALLTTFVASSARAQSAVFDTLARSSLAQMHS